MRPLRLIFGAAWTFVAMALSFATVAAEDLPLDEVRTLLKQNCLRCHEGDEAEGEVRLDRTADATAFLCDGRRWLRARQLVESGETKSAR